MEALYSKTDITDSYQGRQYMKAAAGGTEEHRRSISPIRNLNKIKAPILLMHGTEDKRTPYKGARDMVDAMKKPVWISSISSTKRRPRQQKNGESHRRMAKNC